MKFSHSHWNKVRDAYANRTEPESFRILARVYWHALLYVTTCIVLIAVSYGLWQLVAVFSGPKESPVLVSSEASPPLINRTQLETTVQGFKDRQAKYEFLKSNPPQLSDPSR